MTGLELLNMFEHKRASALVAGQHPRESGSLSPGVRPAVTRGTAAWYRTVLGTRDGRWCTQGTYPGYYRGRWYGTLPCPGAYVTGVSALQGGHASSTVTE